MIYAIYLDDTKDINARLGDLDFHLLNKFPVVWMCQFCGVSSIVISINIAYGQGFEQTP